MPLGDGVVASERVRFNDGHGSGDGVVAVAMVSWHRRSLFVSLLSCRLR